MTKDTKKINIGWSLIIFLALFPMVLWVFSPSFVPRFSNFSIGMLNVGQLLGLVGAAMFAINLILSTRLKFIEKLFNGLDNTYYRHGHLGQIAFVLLLFHPLFLIPKYSNNFFQAAKFLLPDNGLAINLGWYSLVGMILLIVITLFISLKYHIWKTTHKFFGLFFFLASLHIWLIPSDVSHYLPLRIYMLALAFLGIGAYGYYTILGKVFIKKFRYMVKSVDSFGDNVLDIKMEPLEKKLKFNPGQFVFISFNNKKIGQESHPFSLSSDPKEKNISIAVKQIGDYTKKLNTLSIGTTVSVEGPYGVFSHTFVKNKKQIWIAGGIGITPFVSMAKTLQVNQNYDINLYYCLKDENEAVFLSELRKISFSLNGALKVIPFYSKINGRISANIVEQQSGGLTGKEIFICAPPAMITSLKSQFLAKGIDKKFISSEEFGF